jgi:tetratricopeptide (TPR) repeat protein
VPPLSADPAVQRQAGGGTNYGEVNLEAPAAAAAPLAAEDDMEFGAIPQEAGRVDGAGTAAANAPIAVHAPLAAPLPQAEAPRRGRRVLRLLLGALVIVVLGGGALALVPAIGPFGWYWVSDRLKATEYQQLIAETVRHSREALAKDSYTEARRALDSIEQARSGAKRVKGLAAYAAFVGHLRELRFGAEPEVRARAQVLLDELSEAKDVPHLELAQAGRAAVSGQLARARQQLTSLAARDPRNIDVLVLRGELELRAREPKAALEAWTAARAIENSPRTTFGLARAHHAAGALDLAEKEAQAALAMNQDHAGARILLARIGGPARDKEGQSVYMLEQIFKGGLKASPEEIVNAQTLLGDIHLSRSRVTHAESAYAEALKINPKAARALTGLGDTMYRAGRYSEALARFEAAVQADPDDLMAMVGVAKTKLALERLQDSRSMLEKLRQTHPKSMLVNYWHGQVLEALGNRKDAEQSYRAAVREGGKDPDVVIGYVALALLLNQQGRTKEAQQALDEASAKLPSSPAIHKALGELALSQGRYSAAVEQFKSALALDSDDIGAKFKLGSALRRDQKFEDAVKVFDDVAAIDRDYPGLALERGLLYESSGRTDEALKAYEAALAKAPNDPDLMLRVGCGKVAAGRSQQAEQLLRKVLVLRPNSAETNHCLGRALLVEGKNLAEALRMFERSIDLDPHRAEYWLYLGWAANEAGRVGKAEDSLKKALDLDQGLGDAYWQRGVLRARQGAVKDAIHDLTKALELRPSRHEAHAALAEAYYGLGREQEALSEWQKAIVAQPDNATWRFRYGKLLAANNRDDAARVELSKALELVEQLDPRPRWVWEAHHLLARALGARPEAAKHWKAFLSLGPHDSAYRDEAKQALKRLGQPWDGD